MKVEFTRSAVKDLSRLPAYIVAKLRDWVDAIQTFGLDEVRKAKGYHDEPLIGERQGQRSIRLSKAYRAIYVEARSNELRIVTIIEVNKHGY